MADVQPEERVDRRSDVYNRYKQTFGPERQAAQQYEQDKLLRESGKATLTSMKQGGEGLAKVAGESEKAAQMLPVQQAEETSQQALTGEQMASDIALTKRAQAAQNLQKQMETNLEKMSLNVAQAAFERGIEAKKLIMHDNNIISDLAFNQMYQDFNEGRMTKREIETINRRLQYDAKQEQYAAKEMLKTVTAEFEYFMKQGNVDKAKARLKEYLDAQKEALDQAARAQNTAAILNGTFTILGGIGGAMLTGTPQGAYYGAKVGSAGSQVF